jgi:hypothetical protein
MVDPTGMIAEDDLNLFARWGGCQLQLQNQQPTRNCSCATNIVDLLRCLVLGADLGCAGIQPTQTPQPVWGAKITPNAIVPSVTGNYGTCSHQNLVSERAPCAIEQYNRITQNGKSPLTWRQFISMSIYGEVGTTVLANPVGFSCRARATKSDKFTTGNQVGPVLDQVMAAAAVQWLLGNATEGCGANPGSCTEKQFVTWMTKIQAWFTYVKSPLDDSKRDYLSSEVDTEMNRILSGERPYNRCPCVWGNLSKAQLDAETVNASCDLNQGDVYRYFRVK